MRLRLSKDLIFSISVFFLFVATAAYYNFPAPQDESLSFGWEYGNIAEALVQGKGFSNPFGVESGPTAWMPPLFVLLLAGAFYIFGVKTVSAMWAIFIIKYLALATSFYFLLSIANKTPYKKYKYFLALFFIIMTYFNRGPLYKGLHDEWLVLFFLCWMLSLFTVRINERSTPNLILLGVFSFLLPLVSPALGATFLLTEAGLVLAGISRIIPYKFDWRGTLIIVVCFATSTSLWAYRNYQVFGILIPIKSNFGYDLYQANFLDRDGLVTYATFENYHPINPTDIRAEYLALGEPRFTEEYKELAITAIRNDPNRLLKNIGRRAFSAFIFMHPAEDILPANTEFLTADDIKKLLASHLATMYKPPDLHWTSLTLPTQEFESQVHALGLTNEASVLQDWSERRSDYFRETASVNKILRSLQISLIPTLCILIALLIQHIRRNPVFLVAISIYLTYLAPYILVSHYRRYQVPLIGIQSIFIFLVTCALLEKFPFWKALVHKFPLLKKAKTEQQQSG